MLQGHLFQLLSSHASRECSQGMLSLHVQCELKAWEGRVHVLYFSPEHTIGDITISFVMWCALSCITNEAVHQ